MSSQGAALNYHLELENMSVKFVVLHSFEKVDHSTFLHSPLPNVVLLLDQRYRQWSSIIAILGSCLCHLAVLGLTVRLPV